MKYGREGEGQSAGLEDKHAAGSCALAGCIPATAAAKPESTANEVNKPFEGCRNKAIKCSAWKRATRPEMDPRSLTPYGHESPSKISRFRAGVQVLNHGATREPLRTGARITVMRTSRIKSVGRTAKQHAQRSSFKD
jgi:hypothetical protein